MSPTGVYDGTFDESSGRTIETDSCPECDGTLRTEGGETRCTECGLVVCEYWIDHGPERRASEDEERDQRRTGAPLTPARHDRGLTTKLGRKRDAGGRTLSGRKRQQLSRLRREHRRSQRDSTVERNLAYVCGEIRRLTGRLDLPESVRDRAATVFRRAHEADLARGRSLDALAAAAVYAACRCRPLPRRLDEVAEFARADATTLRRAYHTLNVELELPTEPPRPRQFAGRFAAALDLPPTGRRRALELVSLAEARDLAGGADPAGLAAACCYVAACESGENLTQKRVAEVAGLSAATIRTRRQELCEAIEGL
jgi:transcription initiation factor TFIIB